MATFENNINIKVLIDKISVLTPKEKSHILKYLISNNINFTKNINGYFFNLASHNISDELLIDLNEKINLMEIHRNEIINADKIRDDMIRQYKESIENNLQDTIKVKIDEYNNKIKLINTQPNICMNFTKKNQKTNQKYNYDENFSNKIVYNKNSVYYRIQSRMKTIMAKKKEIIYDNYDNYTDEDYNENDTDLNYIIDDNENDVDEMPDDNVCLIDDTIEIEIDENNENSDDNDDDISIASGHSDSNIENKIQIENEKSYYKKLLNNYGFKFNNDKSCILVPQEYIC